MTLLDRFRTQPPRKHADPGVRLAYVREIPIYECALLAEIARDDADARVRGAAVAKLMDPSALAVVASSDPAESVRDEALTMLKNLALEVFEGVAQAESLAATEALTDARTLATVAKTALREEIALRALWRVGDGSALGSIARHARLEPVRVVALAALRDSREIVAVALSSDFEDTGIAAVERLDDRSDIERVAARGKNKKAVKRARTILLEMDERAAAEIARCDESAAADERLRQETVRAERMAVEAARAQAQTELAQEAARRREDEQARERDRLAEQAEQERRRQQREEVRAALERQQQAERSEAQAREVRARQEVLARLTRLAARVEALLAKADLTLKVGERALRDLRTALSDLPGLPPTLMAREREELVGRLKTAKVALTTKVQELRELTDWQRWANLGVQGQLCMKMEALGALEDPAEIARNLRVLQEQWRTASDVPRLKGDALWRRFKAAYDIVWARCAEHFAAEAATRAESLAKKVVFCEKAESLADSTNWLPTAEEIKRLQFEWKSIGLVTRGQERAIWERFRSACDRFFTRRQADLAERKKRWAANIERRIALCAQVEALVDSTDWDAAATEIKRLQIEWRTIGSVKRSRSEAIWRRFHGACDQFFARYALRHEIARGDRVAARGAICAELEALDATCPDVVANVRVLRARWHQEVAARGVDRERVAALDERFAAALARVLAVAPVAFAGTDLDPDANRRRMEILVKGIEDLVNSTSGSVANDASLLPTTRAAAMLKEALAANTIGGKVNDDSRVRAATEEVRQAQASWARIGPVPEDVRRALLDRFTRACRRMVERVGAGRC